MGKLDLQSSLRTSRPRSPKISRINRAIDHLAPGLIFQRLLLDRRQCGIDDQQFRSWSSAMAEISSTWPLPNRLAGRIWRRLNVFRATTSCRSPGQAHRFVDPGIERPQAPFPDPFRYDNERSLAARHSFVVAR
jgi:hypothetical protein